VDDLDDLLAGVQAAQHVLAEGTLLYRRDEVAGDLEVDVCLQEGEADLAHRLRDRLVVEAALAAEIAQRRLQAAGERIEHGRRSVRPDPRDSARRPSRRTLVRCLNVSLVAS
jgi:hypothetical protein